MFIPFHFEDEENSEHFTQMLAELAAAAGQAAFSEAHALGLPKVFATGSEVILENKDGSRKVLRRATEENHDAYFKRFNPDFS